MTTLLLATLFACQDYDLNAKEEDPDGLDDSAGGGGADTDPDSACALTNFPVEDCAATDACDYEVGGFTPVVEWGITGKSSTALPVVGDLTGDGLPEIVANLSPLIGAGTLTVYENDGTLLWEKRGMDIAYGSAAALADIDDDGSPEVLAVVDNGWGSGYSVAALRADSSTLWISDAYTDGEFNWATGIAVSDMDHDGSPEIVAGQVILNADGTERAVGRGGVGASASIEGAHPAIADLDLDGSEEIITGSDAYDADGNTVFRTREQDGAVAVANLDDDPEGEFVVTAGNQIRAHDTDGSVLWGPATHPTANIMSIPAIGDLDADGSPDIVVAGGNEIWALRADGTELWTARVTDESGATGASIFDFDADGIPEVVYIDEVQMLAYNGADGAVKFRSTEHRSVTMYDYPVIADIDGDDHAEIIIASQGDYGLAVFEDATNSWAPARSVWNQHAYSITNINDDLSVPVSATPNFTLYNNFHSALALAPGESLGDDLATEVLEVCEDDCDVGVLRVIGRGQNTGNGTLDAGVRFALYGDTADGPRLLATAETTTPTPPQKTTEALAFDVPADDVQGVTALRLVADDDGTGTGAISECVETNNDMLFDGAFCD
jgi:hypothetical protein